jgi:hypothetical protein
MKKIIILDKKYGGFESWSDIDRDIQEMWDESVVPPEGNGTIHVTVTYEEETAE